MKKLLMAVAVVMMSAPFAFAQEKGQVQFGLGGSLFTSSKLKASGSKSLSEISPAVNIRYFMADNIGIDGGLQIVKFGGDPAKAAGIDKLALNLMVGGRYYYYHQDKMSLNGGVDLGIGLGDGAKQFDDKGKEKSPIDLKITAAEFEYWPMEGGAISADLFYALNGLNLGDNGISQFGIGLGIKIRIK